VTTRQIVSAVAVEAIKRDDFYVSVRKIEFNHPAAELARKLK
jgi:hypothetical protein